MLSIIVYRHRKNNLLFCSFIEYNILQLIVSNIQSRKDALKIFVILVKILIYVLRKTEIFSNTKALTQLVKAKFLNKFVIASIMYVQKNCKRQNVSFPIDKKKKTIRCVRKNEAKE